MSDRLHQRRQRRDLEDKALREGRLPPGQSLTVKWPVLDTGTARHVEPADWRLRLFGLVREERILTWSDLMSFEQKSSRSDIHCVTHWTKLDNRWEGVRARDILGQMDLSEAAGFVMVHAQDYSANFPIGALLDDDVLFAVKHDGTDLPAAHGGPVRLVVPKRYFWKSVKWVNGLEFMAEDRAGYWEVRGYHSDANPWREERFGD